MSERKTIRFEGGEDVVHGPTILALQAVPPHAVLIRLEEKDGFRPSLQLEIEHVRALVKFLNDSFLNKLP